MSRRLIWHCESEALFESFDDAETDGHLHIGCDDVTGNIKFETRFNTEKAMSEKIITVRETFTRDQLTGTRNPEGNEVLAAQTIFNRLRAKGVPVIGTLGVLAIEWGVLTIAHEDGLDGDEWIYTFTGRRMPEEWAKVFAQPGRALRLNKSLAQHIAEADEL